MRGSGVSCSNGDSVSSGRSSDRSPLANGGAQIGPNEPCPCGSGRKYKRCCGTWEGRRAAGVGRPLSVIVAVLLCTAVVAGVTLVATFR